MINKNLGIIGAGNMASSIVKGIINKKLFNPQQIHIFDIDPNNLSKLAEETTVMIAKDNVELVKKSSIIIIAVKPKAYDDLLGEIAETITDDHILVSIAAGISTKYIKSKIDNKCKIVRVMPNTPVLVGEGMSVICNTPSLKKCEMEIIKTIFLSMGRVEFTDEELINGITAISGSSPAYVYLFIEALADGGVMMGLPRDQSYRLAAQSVLGAAKMVLTGSRHPALLKDEVSSPGGTTMEAIYTLEQNGFRGAIMEAVHNCTLKAYCMEEGNDPDSFE